MNMKYESPTNAKKGGIGTHTITSNGANEQSPTTSQTRGLINDTELYSPRSKPRGRPRQNRMVFVGAAVFLAVVLAIVARHSSPNDGNEEHPNGAIVGGHGNGRSPASAPIIISSSNDNNNDNKSIVYQYTKASPGTSSSEVSTGTVASPSDEATRASAAPAGEGNNPNAIIHRQCARGATELKNRPMVIFKSARTGSTWLAWTGQTLELSSGKKMLWTTEVGSCGRLYNSQLAKWFIKYFTQGRKKEDTSTTGTDGDDELHGRKLKQKCHMQVNGVDDYGPIIATIDVKNNPNDVPEDELVPDLSLEQWGEVFKAVPDLAIGVLVRTNTVKRAISSIAVEEQVRICGDKVGKKLTGKEKCIKDLPKQVHLNTTDLWRHVKTSDHKRQKLPMLAARLSSKYSDGKVFCISYEGMEMNMPGEMEDLGNFLGAEIDPKGLAELREKQVSKKRGSDDLSEYIENYEEVRESLSSNRCVLEQLESKQPKVFPACLR